MTMDIDQAALEVARQFTHDNDPKSRAQLQVAIIDLVTRSGLDDTMLLIRQTAQLERLRLSLEALTQREIDRQRLLWMVIRNVGGEVAVDLRSLGRQDWSIAALKNDRSPDGNSALLRAVLNPSPDTNEDGS